MVVISKHCVYVITNKINGKQYVGQTNNFKRRMYNHCLGSDKQVIDMAINKYGKENFKFEIIHDNIPIEEIDDWEIYYINEVYGTYKNKGYNCHIGGNCQAGEYNPMYGVCGEDNPRYGQKHTLESKIKISENHADISGKNNPNYGKLGFDSPNCIINLRDVFEIISFRIQGYYFKEIANKLGVHQDLVNKVCKGTHTVCDQVCFKFDFSVFDDYFNHSSPLTLKDVFLIRQLRKDKLPQSIVANLIGYSKSVINSFDCEVNNLSKLVDKEGNINQRVLKLIKDFSKQYNEVTKGKGEPITNYIKSFINYKKWFKRNFKLDYTLFCKYVVKSKWSRLNIPLIPKMFKLKKKMTYKELQKEIGISPSTACNILKGKYWLNDFLTKEGEFTDEFNKINNILSELK